MFSILFLVEQFYCFVQYFNIILSTITSKSSSDYTCSNVTRTLALQHLPSPSVVSSVSQRLISVFGQHVHTAPVAFCLV